MRNKIFNRIQKLFFFFLNVNSFELAKPGMSKTLERSLLGLKHRFFPDSVAAAAAALEGS